MQCGLTFDHYREMLTEAQSTYEFVFFHEYDPHTDINQFLLRHDIDLSINSALTMALIEAKLGIKSTYFLRLNSTFYNPLSQNDYPKVIHIQQMGHEIGLHFDPFFYENNHMPSIEGIKRDKQILELITGQPVRAISQHRPFFFGLNNCIDERELYQIFVHNDVISEHCYYISDSCQKWRNGCLCGHIGHHNHIQALIHPVWWSETADKWPNRLQHVCREASFAMEDKASKLKARYKSYLEKREDAIESDG